VTNWAAYDPSLRQRGSLTVWFSEEAIAGWRAEGRTTAGGQPHDSALAILTGLCLRAVFRLALRQTEGLIGSIIGSGEWLVEKHGTRTRRSWRKLHIGLDADTGRIVAAELTTNEVDDGFQVGPLLDQVAGAVASFTADGAYDTGAVSAAVAGRHPDAAIIVSPRSTAMPSDTAQTNPTQRDRHLQGITNNGRASWQKSSGYNVAHGTSPRVAWGRATTAATSTDGCCDRVSSTSRLEIFSPPGDDDVLGACCTIAFGNVVMTCLGAFRC